MLTFKHRWRFAMLDETHLNYGFKNVENIFGFWSEPTNGINRNEIRFRAVVISCARTQMDDHSRTPLARRQLNHHVRAQHEMTKFDSTLVNILQGEHEPVSHITSSCALVGAGFGARH
jgi:hypothetical protein